jgi:hypothetical protein
MKRYKQLFEKSQEDIIKQALSFADSEPFPVNKKAFRFMMYLYDENFDKEEIMQLAMDFYKIHRGKIEGLFKELLRIENSL